MKGMTESEGDISVGDISPATDYELRVLRAIRRIFRAVDMQSRTLHRSMQISTPQLVMLMAISRNKPMTLTGLNQLFDLGARTASSIIEELEEKGLVRRASNHGPQIRDDILLTDAGEQIAHEAPEPLQCRLLHGLRHLPDEEQSVIAFALESLVRLLGIDGMSASALITPGPIVNSVHRSAKR